MLGWLIIVSQVDPGEGEGELARWRARVSGLDWMDELISTGAASGGGNGYPMLYEARAADVVPVLSTLPVTVEPKWRGEITVDHAAVDALNPDDRLRVEAWDLS